MAGNSLAVGIDLMVTDFGFNTGCGTSSRIFQNVVGVNPWQIDGRIGPATLGLAATFQTADLIAKLEAAHEAHYAGNPNFKLYGNGWDGRARRAAVVANQMAAAPPAEDVA
jgi:lysozyme family protein